MADKIIETGGGLRTSKNLAKKTHEMMEKMAIRDSLTGLYNRRHFEKMMEDASASGEIKDLGIAILDLDHFKSVNDKYGHDAGDAVLKHVADVLRSNVRSTDTVVRYGGEEFILISDRDEIQFAVPKLLKKVEDSFVVINVGGEPFNINSLTLSAGISMHSDPKDNWEDILKKADQALYLAKENGRNRAIVRV